MSENNLCIEQILPKRLLYKRHSFKHCNRQKIECNLVQARVIQLYSYFWFKVDCERYHGRHTPQHSGVGKQKQGHLLEGIRGVFLTTKKINLVLKNA